MAYRFPLLLAYSFLDYVFLFGSLFVSILLIRTRFLDGFFDAGMLLSALKARDEENERPSEQIINKRNIGRRLKLAEY